MRSRFMIQGILSAFEGWGGCSQIRGVVVQRIWQFCSRYTSSPPTGIAGSRHSGEAQVIYILAVFLPPLALLLTAYLSPRSFKRGFDRAVLIFGFFFRSLWAIPSTSVVAIYRRREDRNHDEVVDAIRRHGPPPGYKP